MINNCKETRNHLDSQDYQRYVLNEFADIHGKDWHAKFHAFQADIDFYMGTTLQGHTMLIYQLEIPENKRADDLVALFEKNKQNNSADTLKAMRNWLKWDA